jgi:GrpB-like predicted nucleotidyltransferase (UPF0157 family)
VGSEVELVPSDPAWPSLYELEAERVREVLGDRVRLLEHVGSTSVPGLVAKPIIDMVLAVRDSADEPSYIPQLEAAGYTVKLREPDWYEHRVLKGPDTDINLHVFTEDCEEIENMVRFRDRLRHSATARERYAEVKSELAARRWESVQDYADAKTSIVRAIRDGEV